MKLKVYVLTLGEYSSAYVVGVYMSLAAAQDALPDREGMPPREWSIWSLEDQSPPRRPTWTTKGYGYKEGHWYDDAADIQEFEMNEPEKMVDDYD